MTDSKTVDPNADLSNSNFQSKLTDGRQRFLAHAIEHALAISRRSAADFIRHFPPEVIMQGIADHPELRASILSQTTGLKVKIAIKKSWQSAAEDLRIALTEGETDPQTVVNVFDPDDRVRYLPRSKIWAFLTEGDFYNVTANRTNDHRIAKQHIAFLLDRALSDGLLTHRDIVDGVTVAELSTRLPKAELGKIIEGALTAGRNRKPFTDVELWSALTAPALVEYVPLPHVWTTVIVPKIAVAHGFSSEDDAPNLAPLATTSAAVAPPEPTAKGKDDPEWVELPEDTVGSSDLISEDDFA
jgi:hypothetical protein